MSDSLIRVSRRAMACEFEVCFPAERNGAGVDAALEALDVVDRLEEQLSYFRPESDISRINLLAADRPVEVEPALFNLLQFAMRLYEETGGAYDITSAPLWEAWGFARRAGQVPSEGQLADARSRVGGHLVELNPAERTIHFRKPGVKINLASIGKGYALDVCAGRLLSLGMSDFLLHGGQSSVLAHGSPMPQSLDGTEAEKASNRQDACSDWEVGISDPRRPGHRMAIIRLSDRALGTSGGQFQSFRHRGHRYGHILDPRCGWPAEGVLSATMLAPTAALADALSTTSYVLGPDAAIKYCQRHPEIGMLMLCPGEGGEDTEIHRVGLGQSELGMSTA